MGSARHPPLSLAYHGVSTVRMRVPGGGLFVRPLDLERQISRLRRWGYELVTFGEQARRVAVGRGDGTASLTFDDGLADNLTTLLPLLRRLDAPATVFVVSGWLGGRHPEATWAPMLTAEQVGALSAGGVEIGAHTVSHPHLTRIGAAAAVEELATSRQELIRLTGTDVDVAAYPYDDADAATLEAAREAGFAAACRGPDGSWGEPLGLPRQHMNNTGGLLGLRLKRTGRYEPLMEHRPAKLARRLARAGRETVRRVSRDRL